MDENSINVAIIENNKYAGMSEKEAAVKIQKYLTEHGFDLSKKFIVAVGANAAVHVYLQGPWMEKKFVEVPKEAPKEEEIIS